jgi:hypothetical protein
VTAPALSIDHATRFDVRCTWHDGTPATLLISTLNDGQWVVSCSVVKGWAVLFLRDGERPPWGRWAKRSELCARHPTAQDALDAAWATEQIGQAT